MIKKRLVTINQAIELKKLGFRENVSHYVHYVMKFGDSKFEQKFIRENRPENWNDLYGGDVFLSIPTVDEAIDWLRRKFHVIIYYSTNVINLHNKWMIYSYAVRTYDMGPYCISQIKIGTSNWSCDSYAMKRQAITIAIRWIKKEKKRRSHKTKIVKMLSVHYRLYTSL